MKLALLVTLIFGVGTFYEPFVAAQKENKPNTPTDTKKNKTFTAEEVVESVIAIYGNGAGRVVLEQIRRNGVERGEVTQMGDDGRTEKANYSWRFIRGENSAKDKFRLDQKSPQLEYALVHNGGQTWGVMRGSSFTPRQDAADSFLAPHLHGLDALLRYKENGSTVALAGREKQKGVDLYVMDVTDKEKRRTRYYISATTARVLWLEYEAGPDAANPIKYMTKFFDYRVAQGTLVPRRTLTFEGGKQVQEKTVKTITYGVKMEDSLFQNPDAPTPSATP